MKSIFRFLLILAVGANISCEKAFMNQNAGIDNLSIFNEYSKICIEKFGLEDLKQINLQELSDSIRPFINDDLTEEELFNYMSIITLRMKEGHTTISNSDESLYTSYPFFLGYPLAVNAIIIDEYYYKESANPDVRYIWDDQMIFSLAYGYLPQDSTIGYLRIETFDMEFPESEVEAMMSYLKNAKGIVIDLRTNLGGIVQEASFLASYLIDQELFIATNFIKNGPGKSDFADSRMSLSPASSSNIYTKPIAVIHDRVTFSSGSLFSIMMDARPNTIRLGQIYGGGTGEIMDGYLSNGWKYTISTSNFIDAKGRPTDNGIDPDIPMVINLADTTTDAIIERAILELQ